MAQILEDTSFRTLGQEGSPWSLKVHEGLKVDSSTLGGVFMSSMKWTRGVNWHVELIYGPFPVEAGRLMKVELEATSTQPIKFSVWLGQYHEPFESLVPLENHFGEAIMRSKWSSFDHIWRPHKDEVQARLVFAIGRSDTTLRIRNPRLKVKDA